MLAASSATAAGRPGARELLDEALAVSTRRFWDDEAGMAVEQWDRTFTTLDGYRGVNANMHTVEAYLAAADVTGDRRLARPRAADRRARRARLRRRQRWRIPEHFDADWQPDLEYNADTPAHPFRPYGATIGHWLEWARLTLHARAAVTRAATTPRPGCSTTRSRCSTRRARGLGRRRRRRLRLHGRLGRARPSCASGCTGCGRGLAAAAALHAATGEARFDDAVRQWWDYIEAHLLDRAGGSWWHELGADNRCAARSGRARPTSTTRCRPR